MTTDAGRAAPHPSSLELDRYSLGEAGADVTAHVAGCETCRAWLAEGAPSAVVPAWARRLSPRRRPRPALRGWRGVGVGVGVAALACAALLLAVKGHPGDRLIASRAGDGYVGVKGGPDLRLYVKRGERIEVWNGSDPVVAGDRLRLMIQPGPFPHVSVFAARTGAAGAYTRLYEAPVTRGQPAALPLSWLVDGRPGGDTLVVVLAAGAVAPADVATVLAAGDGGGRWVRRFVLATAASADGSAP